VLIQAGPKKAGLNHDLRLEFNPSRLGVAGIAFLKAQLEGILVGALSFGHILSTGKITRDEPGRATKMWGSSGMSYAASPLLALEPSSQSPLWVIRRHNGQLASCPLYPQ
jgi:hypothetical protein